MQIPDLRKTLTTPEDVYQFLGNYVVSKAPEGWKYAHLIQEVEAEDVDKLQGFYYTSEDGNADAHSFPVDFQVSVAFRILRDLLAKEGASKWSNATFTIKNDGNLQMNFVYPDTQE